PARRADRSAARAAGRGGTACLPACLRSRPRDGWARRWPRGPDAEGAATRPDPAGEPSRWTLSTRLRRGYGDRHRTHRGARDLGNAGLAAHVRSHRLGGRRDGGAAEAALARWPDRLPREHPGGIMITATRRIQFAAGPPRFRPRG